VAWTSPYVGGVTTAWRTVNPTTPSAQPADRRSGPRIYGSDIRANRKDASGGPGRVVAGRARWNRSHTSGRRGGEDIHASETPHTARQFRRPARCWRSVGAGPNQHQPVEATLATGKPESTPKLSSSCRPVSNITRSP
jgi:hypothetical protein